MSRHAECKASCSENEVNMYYLPPIAFTSADEAAEFLHAYWQVIKFAWMMAALVALTLIVLAGVSAGWLRMITWCNVELSPVACSLYLAGI